MVIRGVVVPERGRAPFQQIFLSRNGAPANIVYNRRNADILQRYGKSAQAAALSIMTYLNVSL